MDYPKKGRYRHFKGGEYELLYIARHSETDESMVVYRALYDCGETPLNERLWVLPLSMWTETVTRDGATFPRFSYIGDDMAADESANAQDTSNARDARFDDGAMPAFSDAEPPLFFPEDEGLAFTEGPEAYAPPEEAYAYPCEAEPPAPERYAPSNKDALMDKARAILRSVYGYSEFRGGQEDLISAILSGRDSLGVMPTGAGKSLCYQIPALALEGVTLVVSPLISLMKDQVAALRELGVPAAFINSSLSEAQQTAALDRAISGAYKIIYVAPERLLTPRFVYAAGIMDVSLIAIDEAHCISQWGQDFRPSYLDIPRFILALPQKPVLAAFTATATEQVRLDIIRLLGLSKPYLRVTGFDRPNLYFRVIRTSSKKKALDELMPAFSDMSGIIYCATRKQVEEVYDYLVDRGIPVTRYHAGLDDAERKANQEAFSMDEKPVMVATNAFGMGIDKSNVRYVIHYSLPKDIESYYQEAGRAGRDGLRAVCVLLYSAKDLYTQKFFIDHMGEESGLAPDEVEQLKKAARLRLDAMKRYATSGRCLRKSIMSYFGQSAPDRCNKCSVCDGLDERINADKAALEVLKLVRELRVGYGSAMLIDILRGANTEAIRRRRLNKLESYGVMSSLDKGVVGNLIDEMVDEDVLKRTEGDYPIITAGDAAEAFERGETHVTVPKPAEKKRRSRKAQTPAVPDKAVDISLISRLKALRMQLSKQRHVPPYMIFSDATLESMARLRPRSREEFLEVAGVGSRKCEQFGDAFIACIADWERECAQ